MSQIERKIYTLSQLNTSLEKFVMKNFGSKQYWVTAEISKISTKNGHRYIELADSSNGTLTAQLSAYMWVSTYRLIHDRIGNDLIDILKPGNNALFLVKIEFHTIFGLKLNLIDIDPNYTYGEIERKKQETIRQLQAEGIFFNQKKLYLPTISKKIALIGSPDTSGYRDFLNELTHNSVYTNFTVKTFPVSVQGQKAIPEIVAAIQEARTYDVDVIVIIRGGGSKMDLQIFSEYRICKEICVTKIPVITGIGHETDEVVADLVSRLNCITPTAAAKHLYVQIAVFSAELRAALDGVMNQSLAQLSYAKDEFLHLRNYFLHHSQRLLNDSRNSLERHTHHMHRIVHYLIAIQQQDLELYLQKCAGAASNFLRLKRDVEIPSFNEKIQLIGLNLIDTARLELNNLNHLLAILNPEKLLQSGYTISTIDETDLYELTINLIGKEMKTLTTHSLITSKIITQTPIKKEKNG